MTGPPLNEAQTQAIKHGLSQEAVEQWPAFLPMVPSIVLSPRTEHLVLNQKAAEMPEGASDKVGGFLMLYEVDGEYFGYAESSGGAMRTTGYPTPEPATLRLVEAYQSAVLFWAEKVRWHEAGDLHPKGGRCLRWHHHHYVIGDEPPKDADRDLLGHGGRCWRITLSDGGLVFSRNVWHQGIIPVEFRPLLPDNVDHVSWPTPRVYYDEKEHHERG